MKAIRLNPEDFDSVILPAPLAVVTFWADWCGPCNNFTPKLNSLAKEFSQVVVAKVNVEEYPSLSKRFDVQGIPHTLIFQDGRPIEKIVGDVKDSYLRERILRALAKASGSDTKQSGSSLESGEKTEKSTHSILETIKNAIQAFLDRISGKR